MLTKIVVIGILLIIVLSLASALFQMLRPGNRRERGEKMARALTVRIGLSLFLLALLIAAYGVGWIKPHTLLPMPAAPLPAAEQ